MFQRQYEEDEVETNASENSKIIVNPGSLTMVILCKILSGRARDIH